MASVEPPVFIGYAKLPMFRPRRRGLPTDVVTLSTCHVPGRTPPFDWPNFWPPRELVLEWVRARDPSYWVLEVALLAYSFETLQAEAPWVLKGPLGIHGLRATLLGYEVIGFEDSGQIHSWRCHEYELEQPVGRDWSLNQFGLIPKPDQAEDALNSIQRLPPEDSPYEIPWAVAQLSLVGDI